MSNGVEIIFLGTGGSLPTRERGLPCVVIRRNGELLIFDCGEGTQRQMMLGSVGFNRVTSVMISHLHGDHVLGIPGLLLTMSSLGRDKVLDIYGPEGIQKLIENMEKSLGFKPVFQVRIRELHPGDKIERTEYVLNTALAKHDITCLAYALEEKPRPGRFHPEKARKLGMPEGPQWRELQTGKTLEINGQVVQPNQVMDAPRQGLKIVYAIDTRPSGDVRRLAKNADLLMHDGGFPEERRPKAQEYYHSTAREAAILAKNAKVKKLALIHISAVVRDSSILLKEAKKQFKSTIVPVDFTNISLKPPGK
jgi:ribonuclease Z